jgi:hypothetical protein
MESSPGRVTLADMSEREDATVRDEVAALVDRAARATACRSR